MKPLDEVTSAILLHGCAVVRHRRPIPPEQPPGDGTGEFTDESTLDVPRNRIPAADTHDISSRVQH